MSDYPYTAQPYIAVRTRESALPFEDDDGSEFERNIRQRLAADPAVTHVVMLVVGERVSLYYPHGTSDAAMTITSLLSRLPPTTPVRGDPAVVAPLKAAAMAMVSQGAGQRRH